MRFVFDFFGCLQAHYDVRMLAQSFKSKGHEVVVLVPAECEFDEKGPLSAVATIRHYRGHSPLYTGPYLMDVLHELKPVNGYWTGSFEHAHEARTQNFSTCLVSQDPHNITSRRLLGEEVEFNVWDLTT